MNTDKTGRPTMTILIHAPGRELEFTGNIWEVSLQAANAKFLGYAFELKGGA